MYEVILCDLESGRSKNRRFTSKVESVAFFSDTCASRKFAGMSLVLDFFRRGHWVCRHDFKAQPGDDNYWIGRSAEMPLPGAGRPVLKGRRYKHAVTLTNSEASDLRNIGEGNLSLGISRALLAVQGMKLKTISSDDNKVHCP